MNIEETAKGHLTKTKQVGISKTGEYSHIIGRLQERNRTMISQLKSLPGKASSYLNSIESTLKRVAREKMESWLVAISSNRAGGLVFIASVAIILFVQHRRRIKELSQKTKYYKGGCHCGQINFQVLAPRHLVAWDCNCTVCFMKKNWHFVVPLNNFRLIAAGTTTADREQRKGADNEYHHGEVLDIAENTEIQLQTAIDKGYLSNYTFNTRVAKHLFCSHCGVQAFYRPRSNPDGVAVTLTCVHPFQEQVESYEIRRFDGRNWENFFGTSGISAFSQS